MKWDEGYLLGILAKKSLYTLTKYLAINDITSFPTQIDIKEYIFQNI